MLESVNQPSQAINPAVAHAAPRTLFGSKTLLAWGAGSSIRHAEFSPSGNEYFEAVMSAGANADPAKLSALRTDLLKHGVTTLLDERGGESVLIARGLDNEASLMKALQSSGAVSGDAQRQAIPLTEPVAKKHMNSRLMSALFYDLGNVACIVSGIQRGRHNPGGKFTRNDVSEMMVGVTFSIGDLLMTVYSKESKDAKARLTKGFEDHLRTKGIELPKHEDVSHDALKKSGVLGEVSNFVEKNMISIKCLTEGTANLFMINAALKKGNFNGGKLAAGLIAGSGWFSTFLIDRYMPPDYPIDSLSDRIRGNPRGWLARPGAIYGNFSNLYGANSERMKFQREIQHAQHALNHGHGDHGQLTEDLRLAKLRQHDYGWNVVAACSFLVANYLFGVSEKSQQPKDQHEERQVAGELITIAANTLRDLPPDARREAIAQAAVYAADQSGIEASPDQIAAVISDKIDVIARSPFAGKSL